MSELVPGAAAPLPPPGRLGWLLACAGTVVVFELGAWLTSSSTLARHAWADGCWILGNSVATWGCWQTARRAQIRHLRRAWWSFTAALVLWSAAMLVWAYLELVRGTLVPFPSINDLLSWLGVPCFVAGLLCYKPRATSRTLTTKQLADLGLIGAALVAVAVEVLYAPALAAPYTATYVASALAAPILGVTALVFGLISLWQHVAGPRRRVLALLLAGIGLLAGVSILYAEALLAGRYQPGAWIDVLWLIAMLLIATAAREERGVAADDQPAATERPARFDPLVPTGALLAWVVVGVFARHRGDGDLVPIEAITGATLIAAMFVRIWATGRLERALTARVAHEETRAWELEARLTRAHKLEAVGTLAGGVAHDFNNVLAAATSGLKLARRKLARGGDVDRDLDEIESVLWRATDLTGRLLNLARKREPTRVPLDPREIVGHIETLLGKVLPAGVRLKIVEPDRWVPTVVADPGGLEHALLNLGLNARDVLRERGGTISIRVYRTWGIAGIEGDAVAIEVRDDGPGMAPEVARRVFEPFFTTKAEGEGTGLGLAMVDAFAAENRGVVAVESALGKGTCFRISLPAAEDEPTGEVLPAMTGTVLVMCPQDAGGLATTGALERCGFTTLMVADPAAALVVARRGQAIEVVVADAGSGIVAGDSIRALRAAGMTAPIVLLAGPGAEDSGDWAAIVRKPVDARELADQVRSALAGR